MDKTAGEFRYDSFCGIYCGACDILAAYRKGLESGAVYRREDLPAPLKHTVVDAPIVCHGCKTDTVFGGCGICFVRRCAKKRHDIESCLDCRRYPCIVHGITRAAIAVLRIKKKLPHLRVARRNLTAMEERGVDAWLADQRGKWACPHCATSFTWYQSTCAGCGRNLEPLKEYRT